jgi:hypothetical protein
MARSLVVLLIFAGCDSKATASDPQGGRGDQRSKEYESCSSSAQCNDELRCFDHACRTTKRSTVGDYYAALGAQLRGKGDLENALSAYSQAIGHYDTEHLTPPADVDCAYGGALVAARSKKEHAELGARVLHRCLIALPVGSSLRERALADLAQLNESGLDPLTLGKNQPADTYLTRAPSRPATDKLSVTAAGSPAIPGKSGQAISDKLNEAEVKAALVACWDSYNTATKKDTLAVTLPVKVAYYASEYADDPDEHGQFSTKVEAGGSAAEDGCVRTAAEPAIKGLQLREAFSTKLTITIK